MAHPIAWWEIVGNVTARLAQSYHALFGWQVEPSPTAVPDMDYRFAYTGASSLSGGAGDDPSQSHVAI